MAKRKKAKGKTNEKRKKPKVTKAAATRRKTRTVRKKRTKKAPVQRASPKKARPTAKPAVKPTPARPTAKAAVKPTPARPTPKAAVKPTPASPPAQPVAAATMQRLPGQPTPQEERIGVVTHYYSHLSVATLRLESGTLRVGDVIHIRGHTTDFSQRVESLEVNHAAATEVGPNDDFGLKVVQHAREHDAVYKVRP
jgi:hypothetical protein